MACGCNPQASVRHAGRLHSAARCRASRACATGSAQVSCGGGTLTCDSSRGTTAAAMELSGGSSLVADMALLRLNGRGDASRSAAGGAAGEAPAASRRHSAAGLGQRLQHGCCARLASNALLGRHGVKMICEARAVPVEARSAAGPRASAALKEARSATAHACTATSTVTTSCCPGGACCCAFAVEAACGVRQRQEGARAGWKAPHLRRRPRLRGATRACGASRRATPWGAWGRGGRCWHAGVRAHPDPALRIVCKSGSA